MGLPGTIKKSSKTFFIVEKVFELIKKNSGFFHISRTNP